MVKRFEVVMCDVHGIQKPGLIVSPDEMNESLPYAIIAPITTIERNFPCRVGVRLKGQQGQVALDMIRAVPQDKIIEKIGLVPENTGREILDILKAMFEL